MKAVLLGPKGQLGTDILAANETRRALQITPVARDKLDLSDLTKVHDVLGAMDFDVLINCASYHKTDEVEVNAQQGILINAHLVRDLAALCAKKKARFVTISTDYVFGGQAKRQPLSEDDAVAPVNVYGATKLMGEALALSTWDDSLILRVSSLFGVAGANGKGGNFVETMLRLAKEKGSLRVVDDQIMSPTATADIATGLLKLLETKAQAGIYNVAGTGHASWWAFAKRIVEESGLGTKVPVEAVPTSEFPTPARRPAYSVLSSGKLAATIGWAMPSWEDALDRYLRAKGHKS